VKLRLTALSLALCAWACGSEPRTSVIELEMPRSVRQALTDNDAALCSMLAADVTFGQTNSLAPALDRVPLDAKQGQVCTWVLGRASLLHSGTYDLVVRFSTKGPVMSCTAPIVVGAFVKRGLDFPFKADFTGLTDQDFYYKPGQEGQLRDSTVDFNISHDMRSNLAKLAQGADPCKANSIPQPTLETMTSSVTETGTVALHVTSVDADDIAHVVSLHIKHHNGPNVGTETIIWRSYTDGRGGGLVTQQMGYEQWTLRALADTNSNKGAGDWQIIFVPSDPFVGDLSAWVVDDDGQGDILSHTATLTLHVKNIVEPVALVFGDSGRGTRERTLRFQQQGQPPTSYDFRFYDQEIGANYQTWTPTIATGPSGLSLTRNAGFWNLAWSPTLDQSLTMPAGGYPLIINFKDATGALANTASVSALVSPRFNNAPTIMPPNVGDLDLPPAPFMEHRIPFVVVDPDQVSAAPTCMATVMNDTGTSCASPFASVRCEPSANPTGPSWPFVVILTPGSGYASCGSNPAFLLSLSITDVPPADSSNGPQTTGLGMPLSLRTASAVGAAVVMGGPAAVPGATAPSPPLIHGTTQKAIIEVLDGTGTNVLTVVDLTQPNGTTSPSFVHRFTQAEFCYLDSNKRPREIFASDELHARMVVISRGNPVAGDCMNSGDNGLNIVSLSPYSTTFHTSMQICNDPFNDVEGNPTVDAAGNFYIPCQSTPPQVTRIKPDGTITSKVISLYNGNDSTQNRRTAIVADATAKPWLVWPDSTGLVIIDLSTFDQATPTASHIMMGANWAMSTIDDAAADPWRPEYLIAFNAYMANAQLLRVRFGATRVLDPPLDIGMIGGNTGDNYSYMRLVFRNAGPGSVDPGPDLIVATPSTGEPVPHVDLDTWRITATRPGTDYFLGTSAGLFGSPDKRYYVSPSPMNDTGARGIYLYRYDPTVARQFITLPVPTGAADWAARTEYSDIAKLMVISENDTGAIDIIYFIEAAKGLD
jgi:hypothetical protein